MPPISEIVPYDAIRPAQPSRNSKTFGSRSGLSRRELLARAAVGGGVLLSVRMSGLFSASPAGANHVGNHPYQIATYGTTGCDGVGWYGKEGTGECNVPCGGSTIVHDACVWDQFDHKYGYHKSGGGYALRPNICNGDGFSDGWNWKGVDTCCGGACTCDFRCHDGYKFVNGGMMETICSFAYRCY